MRLSKMVNHDPTMSADTALPRHIPFVNEQCLCTCVQANAGALAPHDVCHQRFRYAQEPVMCLLAHQMADRAGELGRLRSSKGIRPLSSW